MRMPDAWRGVVQLPERRPKVFVVVAGAFVAALTALVWMLVAGNGISPLEGQALGYIYRSEELLRQISQGVWWPQLDLAQYNGAQPLRYAGPLPAYLYAAFAAAAGDGVHAFASFCAAAFAFGCVAWLCVCQRLRRGWLGLCVGPLWFSMPANLAALFSDGDIPRAVALCLLPLLLYHIYAYLDDERGLRLGLVSMLVCALTLCDVTFTLLVIACLVIYLAVFGIACRRWSRLLCALCALICGVACAGFWLVPSLLGDTSSLDVPQMASNAAQGLLDMLNPLTRSAGVYASINVIVLAVFGIVCARRQVMPGFWAALAVVLLASQAAAPAVAFVTGGADAGVARVLSIAALLALFSFVLWKSLKTGLVVLACALLLVDIVPSMGLVWGNLSGADPVARLEAHSSRALIEKAKAVCTQRLGLVGEDFFDTETAYLVAGLSKACATSQGSTDQLATTTYNYTQVNQALEDGSFGYVFDRSLELGDDTVLLNTEVISAKVQWTVDELDRVAKKVGYSLVANKGGYRLYHMDTPKTFGVKSDYRALAIGSAASFIARQFPAFEEAPDTPLDSFTYDELKDYEIIYLDGFSYSDRAAAEDLVERLADAGVDVIIAADGIPNEEHTGEKAFLGLDSESIAFKGGFPTIYTQDGPLETELFPSDYVDWNTVYVNGLVDVLGVIHEGSRTLPVCGTLANSHIKVVALNLTFYEGLTGDQGVAKLLSRTLGVLPSELPSRKTVELSVTQEGNSLTVMSDEDDVDTTIAAADNMQLGDTSARGVNNFLYVDHGKTVIGMATPWLWQGVALSVAGLAATLLIARPAKRIGEPAEAPADESSSELTDA